MYTLVPEAAIWGGSASWFAVPVIDCAGLKLMDMLLPLSLRVGGWLAREGVDAGFV